MARDHRIVTEAVRKKIHEFGHVEYTEGDDIQFKDGMFRTNDDQVADIIRKSNLFGEYISEIQPTPPEPTEALTRIGLLAAAQDVEGLEELAESEADGWKRETVLEAAGRAIGVLVEHKAATPQHAPEGASEPKGEKSLATMPATGLSTAQLIAVVKNDTEAFEDAGRVEVPAAITELTRRAELGDEAAAEVVTATAPQS